MVIDGRGIAIQDAPKIRGRPGEKEGCRGGVGGRERESEKGEFREAELGG